MGFITDLVVQKPDGSTIKPKLSGLGGNLKLASYGNQTKLFLRREKTTLSVTVIGIPTEKECILLYQNEVITQLDAKSLNQVFEVEVKLVVRKPPFKPLEVSVPERRISCSVVIPIYNMKNMLKKNLTALLPQLSERGEIIVVDDGSNDGTGAMVKTRFPKVRYFRQERKGRRQQKARNKGIREAKNDCIIMLDADCIPLKGFLKAHKYYFDPAAVQTGAVHWQDQKGNIRSDTAKKGTLKEGELDKIRAGNLCFSRSEALKIGGFTEDYDGAWGLVDQDFAYKVIYLLNGEVRVNPQAQVIHQYRSTPRENREVERNRAILHRKLAEYKLKKEIAEKTLFRESPNKTASTKNRVKGGNEVTGRALWYIPSGRNFRLFWDWVNRVNFVDKLIVKNHLTHEAHNIARRFFFAHDYDYLIIGHDDYLGSPDHIRLLLEDEEKYRYPIISGWSNIWLPPYKKERQALASLSLRRASGIETRNVTMENYGFVAMREILTEKFGFPIVNVWFIGFPLTLIRRETYKKISLKPFKNVNDEFCYTSQTKKDGRGIVFDLQFAIDCEKHNIPIRVDTRVFLLHFGKQNMYKYLRMGKDKPSVTFIKREVDF